MTKCQSFKKSCRTLPVWLSSGEWYTALVVLIVIAIPSSHGCLRHIGRVARRPVQQGVEVGVNLSPVPRQTKSLPDLRPKDPKVNPLDRDPSDAIHLVQLDASRRSSSLDMTPARVGQRSEDTIQTSATSRLRAWARNGGRSFSRTFGSFPSYSRHTLRTIHIHWRNFRTAHPAAMKYAKWVSWLSGIAVSVGSAVSLPLEPYRTFCGLNQTDTEIMTRIENITTQLDRLQSKVCRSSNPIWTKPFSISTMHHSDGPQEDHIDLGLKTFQETRIILTRWIHCFKISRGFLMKLKIHLKWKQQLLRVRQ